MIETDGNAIEQGYRWSMENIFPRMCAVSGGICMGVFIGILAGIDVKPFLQMVVTLLGGALMILTLVATYMIALIAVSQAGRDKHYLSEGSAGTEGRAR